MPSASHETQLESYNTHHPAPSTLRPMHSPTPRRAQRYGDVSARNRPGLNASPCPVIAPSHVNLPPKHEKGFPQRTGEEQIQPDNSEDAGTSTEVPVGEVRHNRQRLKFQPCPSE